MKMNEREVLELALEGARAKLDNEVKRYSFTRAGDEAAIDRIRAALAKYDKIKEQIGKE